MLALKNEIQHYHLDMEVIPKYINTIEDSHNKSKRAGNPITTATLLLIGTNAMLFTDRLPRAEKIWEDLRKDKKDWFAWKICTRQLTRRPRSISRPLEDNTNLGHRMVR